MKCVVKNNSSMDMGPLLPLLKSLLPYSREKLGFNRPPSLFFASDTENASKPLGKTAFYDPEGVSITIFVDGRHPKDILRSISHELVHHMQHERGDFGTDMDTGEGYAQKNDALRELEREAYESGNMCFRDWEDENKHALQEAKQHFDRKNKKMSGKDKRSDNIESLLMEKWGFKHQIEEEFNIDVPVSKTTIKKTISEDFIRDIIKRAISSSRKRTLNEVERDPAPVVPPPPAGGGAVTATGQPRVSGVDAIKLLIEEGLEETNYQKIQRAGKALQRARRGGVAEAEEFWEQLINGQASGAGSRRLQHDIAVRALKNKTGIPPMRERVGVRYFLYGEHNGVFFVDTVEEFRAMEKTSASMEGQNSSREKAIDMLGAIDAQSTNYAHELFKSRWNIEGRTTDAGGRGVSPATKEPSRMPLTYGLWTNDAYDYLTTRKEKWKEEKKKEDSLWKEITDQDKDADELQDIATRLMEADPDSYSRLFKDPGRDASAWKYRKALRAYAKDIWTEEWQRQAPQVNYNRDYAAPMIKDARTWEWLKSFVPLVRDPHGKVVSSQVDERLREQYDILVYKYESVEDHLTYSEFKEFYNDYIEDDVMPNEIINANKFFNWVRIGHQSSVRKAGGDPRGAHDPNLGVPFRAADISFFELFVDDNYKEYLIPKDFSDESMKQVQSLSESFSNASIQSADDLAAWAQVNLIEAPLISEEDILENNITNAINVTTERGVAELVGSGAVEPPVMKHDSAEAAAEFDALLKKAVGSDSSDYGVKGSMAPYPASAATKAIRDVGSYPGLNESLLRKVVQEALKRKFGE